MARVLLDLIPETALLFKPPPPGFAATVADTLGGSLDGTDSFDSDLLAVASSVSDTESGIAALDSDLADAGFTPGDFSATQVTPIAQALADVVTAGDPLLGDVLDSIGAAPPVPGVTDPSNTVADLGRRLDTTAATLAAQRAALLTAPPVTPT